MSSNISDSVSVPSNEEHFWNTHIHCTISRMLVPEDIINLTRVSQCFKKLYSGDTVWKSHIEGYRNLQGEVVEIPQPNTVSYKQFYVHISKNNMTNVCLKSGIWSNLSFEVVFHKTSPDHSINSALEWKLLSCSSMEKACKLIVNLLKSNPAFAGVKGPKMELETEDTTTKVKATVHFRVKGDQYLHTARQQMKVDYNAKIRELAI